MWCLQSPPYDSTLTSQLNNSGHSTSSGDTPPTPMSKTCMLVAAAVGPLAPGFKFPKTKKVNKLYTIWFHFLLKIKYLIFYVQLFVTLY